MRQTFHLPAYLLTEPHNATDFSPAHTSPGDSHGQTDQTGQTGQTWPTRGQTCRAELVKLGLHVAKLVVEHGQMCRRWRARRGAEKRRELSTRACYCTLSK